MSYDKVIDSDEPAARQSLQFQDFHANETIESAPRPTTTTTKALWTFEYYQQFFDVDSETVKTRTLQALFPTHNFFETCDGNPDLYAPVWFSTTVITVLYFSSTVAGYLAAHNSGTPFAYQFSTLTIAATLIWSYTFLIPVAVWGLLRWYKCEPSILEILCLYGYSNAAWVPVSIVAISPLEFLHFTAVSNWLRWIAVIVGFLISGAFLLRNLLPVVNRADAKTAQLMTVGVVCLHVAFAVSIKVLFFSYVS